MAINLIINSRSSIFEKIEKGRVVKMKKRIIVPFCFIFAATVLIAFRQAETAGKNEIEAETHFFALNTYISLTAYGERQRRHYPAQRDKSENWKIYGL